MTYSNSDCKEDIMSYSQTVDPQLASLTALVEDIVKKVC